MKESPGAKAEGSGYWVDNLIVSDQEKGAMVEEEGALGLEN